MKACEEEMAEIERHAGRWTSCCGDIYADKYAQRLRYRQVDSSTWDVSLLILTTLLLASLIATLS
jgi:hypothetical protein